MQHRTPLHLAILLLITAMASGCSSTTRAPVTSLSARLQQIATRSSLVVAHRGDSGTYPENTLPAFEAAVRNKADMVELDFRQTADGALVCMHDGILDRCTDSRQQWKGSKLALAKYQLQQLQDLDAGNWKHRRFRGTRIPTLEAALVEIQRGSITMVEHKAGDPERLVALLRRLKLVDEVLVQSFRWKFLERLHALEPRLTLAVLGGSERQPSPTGEVLKSIERTHSSMVHWSFHYLSKADVVELHRRGYLVCVFTVDRVEDYRKAIEMGVDAITTNYPARLRSYLRTAK